MASRSQVETSGYFHWLENQYKFFLHLRGSFSTDRCKSKPFSAFSLKKDWPCLAPSGHVTSMIWDIMHAFSILQKSCYFIWQFLNTFALHVWGTLEWAKWCLPTCVKLLLNFRGHSNAEQLAASYCWIIRDWCLLIWTLTFIWGFLRLVVTCIAMCRYGATFSTHVLGTPTILTKDVEISKWVYSQTNKVLSNAIPRTTYNILGPNSVFIMSGNLHKKVRDLMKGPLSINELVGFIPTVHKAASDAIATWKGQTQIRVYHEMKKVTTSLTGF